MDPVVVEDFIDQSTCEVVMDLLDPLLQETPRFGIRGALGYETSVQAASVGNGTRALSNYNREAQEEAVSKLEEIYKNVKSEMERHFGLELDLVNCTYQELVEGAENLLHSDSTKLDGSPWRDDGVPEELEYSALVYLNNWGEDFTGGEIEFPLQNVLIHPRQGQLLYFKGDVEHIHEVKRVESGIRKNLVFFYARKGNISDLRYFEDSGETIKNKEEYL